jgi:hypothetical protein
MANKGSHQDGDINTTMRQLFKPIGVAPTKGLIDAGQEDTRSGHLTTKNTMSIGREKPADISGPMGTEVRFRK